MTTTLIYDMKDSAEARALSGQLRDRVEVLRATIAELLPDIAAVRVAEAGLWARMATFSGQVPMSDAARRLLADGVAGLTAGMTGWEALSRDLDELVDMISTAVAGPVG